MQLEYGGQRYPVAAGDLIIGSGSESTLLLAAPGVLARHAVVRRLSDTMAVVVPAVAGAEILVNGTRLGTDPIPLMHGDRLVIAGLEVTVSDPRQEGATHLFATVPGSTGGGSGGAARSVPAPGGAAGRGGPSHPALKGGRLVSLIDGREYPIAESPFVLGREAGSDVVIPAEAASRRHAELVGGSEGHVLVDLSANGTYVNGERVVDRRPLIAADVIRIEDEEFRYYPPERPAPPVGASLRLGDTIVGLQAIPRRPPTPFLAPSEPPFATLLVRGGAIKGERLAVRTPVVNIGRADYNDLRLPDPSVSASHAKLQLREGVWMLTDLGSTNGTRVDGEPVREETPLSPGVTVRFGEVDALFEPRDEGAARGSGTVVLQASVLPLQPVSPPSPPPPPVASSPLRLGPRPAGAPSPWRHPVQRRRRPRRTGLIAGGALLVVLLLYVLLFS